ncbi:hypothetical protein [Niastella populi]|nr:hypothetical protein [Niastella populi]
MAIFFVPDIHYTKNLVQCGQYDEGRVVNEGKDALEYTSRIPNFLIIF